MKRKGSVKRTIESLGHRPICIMADRVKGPLNHVQTEIWAAHVRSIQMFATHTHTHTHTHSDDSAGYCNEHRTSTSPCYVSIILQGRRHRPVKSEVSPKHVHDSHCNLVTRTEREFSIPFERRNYFNAAILALVFYRYKRISLRIYSLQSHFLKLQTKELKIRLYMHTENCAEELECVISSRSLSL